MSQRPAPYPRGVRFDCRDHSWCCDDQHLPEYLDDDDSLRAPPARRSQISERENGLFVSVGVHEGNRPYMEDRHRVMYARDGHRGYFAVHDGHGGSEAAQYLAEHLYEDMITAIDEKLRSNKRFKSSPDDPIKRIKTETNVKTPSSSSLVSSSGSEKSESSSPPKNEANGLVPKRARSSLPSIQTPDTVNDQKTPLPRVSEASPSDVELADVTSPKADNASELQGDAASSSPASKASPTSDQPTRQDVYLEDHETPETLQLVEEALREGCFSCESHLLDLARVNNFTSGSTSVSVFVRGNHLYAINVGDSRAVLCRNGQAVDLSTDHKPGVPSERERIEEHEGEVGQMIKSLPLCCAFFGERERSVGAYRVWPGGLSVSRTFGDVNYKDPSLGKTHSPHILIADPEIKVMEITPEDEFMILATDGFWDVMSSQDAVKFLRKKKRKKKFIPSRAGAMLCDRAYNYGSGDNITCIVVYFTHHCDSWARTPHRAPDHLTRIPYRVDAACQTVQSIDGSAQQFSNGVFDADGHESQANANGGLEVKTQDLNDSAPAAAGADGVAGSTNTDALSQKEPPSSRRRVSHSKSKSKSKSKRPSMSKSHSRSRPRDATKRKGSRSSSSYNRSPSKNDTRNGYRRQSLFEKKTSEEQALLASCEAAEAAAAEASDAAEADSQALLASCEAVEAAQASDAAEADSKAAASVASPEGTQAAAQAPNVASGSSEETPAAAQPSNIATSSSAADSNTNASKELEPSQTPNDTSHTPSQSSSQPVKSHRRERTEPTPASDSPFADVKDALKNRNSLPSVLTASPTADGAGTDGASL